MKFQIFILVGIYEIVAFVFINSDFELLKK